MFIERLDEGESIEAVARGADLLGRPVLVARTDKRGVLLRLNKSFEVKGKETISLGKLDRKLRRMALVKGTFLSPPGEPVFRNDREKELYDAARDAIGRVLEPEENLMTLGLARDSNLDPEYFYVAFTDRRVLVARLFDRREIVETRSIPLADLETWEARSGEDPVPIDVPIMSNQDQRLYLKTADGEEIKLLSTDLFGFRREDSPD